MTNLTECAKSLRVHLDGSHHHDVHGHSVPDHPEPWAGVAAGPACIVCVVPFVWPVLAALGLGSAALMLFLLSDYTSVALLGSGALLDLHRTLHVRHRVGATV